MIVKRTFTKEKHFIAIGNNGARLQRLASLRRCLTLWIYKSQPDSQVRGDLGVSGSQIGGDDEMCQRDDTSPATLAMYEDIPGLTGALKSTRTFLDEGLLLAWLMNMVATDDPLRCTGAEEVLLPQVQRPD